MTKRVLKNILLFIRIDYAGFGISCDEENDGGLESGTVTDATVTTGVVGLSVGVPTTWS